MSEPIIRVEGLGKKYLIKHQESRVGYRALRDVLMQGVRTGFGLFGNQNVQTQEEFWALQDVSFDVQPGEVIGIIGRNGAGKSTLLKILSRITEPTKGRVTLNGRVASLLEVGTGFHPELTGRENIYLNGAILGMGRTEIRRKFDEIVAFAEVEKFLDTPVKRYSSGMYVRLAFAVAAHLEPEILIVDEVLAVGDAQFQKKCLGKMNDVAKGGRTVLFVSHNMGVVQSLCKTGILLNNGRVIAHGDTTNTVAQYSMHGKAGSGFTRDVVPKNDVAITAVSTNINYDEEKVLLETKVELIVRNTASISIDIRLFDLTGTAVGFAPIGSFNAAQEMKLSAGSYELHSQHDVSQLGNGSYSLSVDVARPTIGYIDRIDQVVNFDINAQPKSGDYRSLMQGWGYGSVHFPYLSSTMEKIA